jgi:hypothetical protein
MQVRISGHAKIRLKQRGIPQKRVIQTIETPDHLRFSYRNRRLYQKRFSDKILEVVAIAEGNNLIVVTAYYL